MKILIVSVVFLAANTALADQSNPDVDYNTETVVQVNIGDLKQGSGLVVSTEGHILIPSSLADVADACDKCEITVSEGGVDAGSYKAKMLTFDRKVALAVLKTEHKFPKAVVLEDLRAVAIEDDLIIIGMHCQDGKQPFAVPILTLNHADEELVRLGWSPSVLAEYFGAPGMLGAGGFNSRTGRLIGIILGQHKIFVKNGPPIVNASGKTVVKGEMTAVSALAPATTIRAFLESNGVPVAVITTRAKKK